MIATTYTLDQSIKDLQRTLESSVGIRLQLKINDNRSTMLSVKWEPDCTKVSLHRMFLQAPHNIMQDLACYLKREHKKLTPGIKAYIEHNLQKLDYSHELDLSKLETKGAVYDLKEIYNSLNQWYFNGLLRLHITWFGERKRSRGSQVTFGLFQDPLRLIKVNRLLDSGDFPDYFVHYVVYHEMLHHVCPARVDVSGFKHIHSKEFKQKEQQFAYFEEARQWIQENENQIFIPND